MRGLCCAISNCVCYILPPENFYGEGPLSTDSFVQFLSLNALSWYWCHLFLKWSARLLRQQLDAFAIALCRNLDWIFSRASFLLLAFTQHSFMLPSFWQHSFWQHSLFLHAFSENLKLLHAFSQQLCMHLYLLHSYLLLSPEALILELVSRGVEEEKKSSDVDSNKLDSLSKSSIVELSELSRVSSTVVQKHWGSGGVINCSPSFK